MYKPFHKSVKSIEHFCYCATYGSRIIVFSLKELYFMLPPQTMLCHKQLSCGGQISIATNQLLERQREKDREKERIWTERKTLAPVDLVPLPLQRKHSI
jgi:hypothetical protein